MTFNDPYRETLDDPSISFDKRWRLLKELDQANKRFGIYKEVISLWDDLASKKNDWPINGCSILEVGSGSGGLSQELENWSSLKKKQLHLNLYDSQEDVLKEAAKGFTKSPNLHLAKENYLRAYKDQEFDYVISLHVLHHIQPLESAIDAMAQMARISKYGVLVVDFNNRPLNVTFGKIANFFMKTSKDLTDDGIKSLRRSFSASLIQEKISDVEAFRDFDWKIESYLFWPYWKFEATRKRQR